MTTLQNFFVNKTPSFEIFEETLAIQTPWKIDDISFQTSKNNEQELHISLSFMKGSRFNDKSGIPCPIHSTYKKIWRHIDFEEKRCYLHCKVPIIKTTEDTFQTVEVSWARQNSGFSLHFETEVINQIKNGQTFSAVGDFFNEESNRIWTIFNGWMNASYTKSVVDTKLSAIGIDEIVDQAKGQQITITVDLKNEHVLRVTQGIGQEALQDVRNYLVSKGIPPEQINHVSSPLPKTNESHRSYRFLEDVKTCFPSAEYYVDRLYIIELLNDAMDQIRQKATKGTQETKDLTEYRALFVKTPTLLSDKQKKEVQKLSAQFPNVGKTYELKTAFSALWNQSSPQTAEAFLESWCQQVSQTKLSPLKSAANLLKTHKQHIVRFLDLPADPSVMGKIHENILAATKRTKGLKSFENVSNMIYFCCGKLTFPYH